MSSGKGEGYVLSQFFLVWIVACALGNTLIGYFHRLKCFKRPWLTWLFTPGTLLAVFSFKHMGSITEIFHVRWRLIIFLLSVLSAILSFVLGYGIAVLYRRIFSEKLTKTQYGDVKGTVDPTH
jgi:prepilin signal peptidase PulO-like enzyme (type II secretory pathway)